MRTARTALSPDERLRALSVLIDQAPAGELTALLVERLADDADIHILWPCTGWLIDRFGEVAVARRTLLSRLERDPNPAVRRSVLQLLSVRFGAAESVRRAVARTAANDLDAEMRQLAWNTLRELEQIRTTPPAPKPLSYSAKELKIWEAAQKGLIDALRKTPDLATRTTGDRHV